MELSSKDLLLEVNAWITLDKTHPMVRSVSFARNAYHIRRLIFKQAKAWWFVEKMTHLSETVSWQVV